MVRCANEEATRRYYNFIKKNEVTRKHIRKYRVRYWAVNQIEELNLEEEAQDVVGDLIDTNAAAATQASAAPFLGGSAQTQLQLDQQTQPSAATSAA